MNMHLWLQRGILLTALAAILSLLIPVLVYRKASFRPTLTDTERAVINYAPSQLKIAHKSWQQSTLKQPLGSGATTVGTTTGPAQLKPQLPPPPAPPPSVSFILQDGSKSMAIIAGSMVKAGDRVQGWQVERIERNRVLLRNPKGTTWLKLD